LAPRGLAPPLHSLPPILDDMFQTPTSSCSKGSRGLSVQPRVLGIFTETTVSPDPSLRQRPSRCAIRAGRNFALFLRFRRRRLSLHPELEAQGPASHHGHRFRSREDRDLTSSRTISRYGVKPFGRLPTGLPSRYHDALYVAYEEGFPVISRYAGCPIPARAIQLPDKEFRSSCYL
jgi:hypothetical protein